MRVLPLIAIAFLVCGCGSSPKEEPRVDGQEPAATASPVSDLDVEARVTPAKAGTPERPQGVTLDLALKLGSPSDVEPPLVTRADVRLPQGTRYGGGELPAGSRVGRGTVVADADTSRSEGTIAVLNGGAGKLFLNVVLTNPVRVQAVVPGTVRDGRLRLTFPKELQVVAGVPLVLRELSLTAGRESWLATTACPAGGAWKVAAAVEFDDGSRATRTEQVPCEA